MGIYMLGGGIYEFGGESKHISAMRLPGTGMCIQGWLLT